jgi:uncharacterized protein YrrD
MLRPASKLKAYAIEANDGTIGTVSDLLFDDSAWKIKWLVVDTGSWLTGRKVLIHPSAIETVDDEQRRLSVSWTKAQIESSPDIDHDQPVSRQMESNIYGYYGCSPYWGDNFYGMGQIASPLSSHAYFGGHGMVESPSHHDDKDPHLRSAAEVRGYHIHASDGDIGHVDDLIVEDKGWGVRYLVIDTKNWWIGQHVLVSPYAVRKIIWADRKIEIDISRDQIKSSPPWQPFNAIDEDYERQLHSHYAWLGYGW